MKNQIMFSIIVGGIALSSCNGGIPQSPTITPYNKPTLPSWVQSEQSKWTRGEPCSSPCWEEITTGINSCYEAHNKWENNPIIRDIAFTIKPLSFGTATIRKAILFDQENPQYDVYLTCQSNDQILNQISVGTGYDIPIRPFIAKYGEPDYIVYEDRSFESGLTDPSKIHISVSVIWMEKGMFLANITNYPVDYAFSIDSEFPFLVYFAPGIEGFHKTTAARNIEGEFFTLYPWHDDLPLKSLISIE